MMPHFQSVYRWLLPALGGAVLMLGAMTAAARGEGYGELGSFGKGAGTGNGQFKITSGTHAFGVDPTDNSVYVGDEPTAGEYRVQKLSVTGQFLASASFKPANAIALEGIAVDPARERVYLLAVAFRGAGASIDPSMRVAGTLYAFKTKPTGEKLESAVGGASKEAEEGVLASPGTLAAESEVQGQALLEPGGIAVDPSTHDVIVMGSEDQGIKAGAPQLRVALERVSEKGALGSRYIDKTNCFGGTGSVECEEGGTKVAKAPNSPVVSQAGRVYVESYDQIWEIPSEFLSAQPPKSFIQFSPLLGEKTLEGPHQELVEFPGEPAPAAGGGLTIAPEGTSDGTIYSYAKVAQEKAGELVFKYPGALAFRYSEDGGSTTGTEIGWTGGQSAATGGGKCTISFLGGSRPVAAGKEHDLFVFDPNPATAKHGAEPHVIEFGPGGTGCPTASATAPSATVKGQPATEVPAGTKVTLSSTVTQANALSVAWDFGDGETETVSEDEFLSTKVIHEYTLGGEHTITETIHTDDLQTPEIVVTGKLTVTGGVKEAVKITTQPVAREVKEGETATFTAAGTGVPTPTVQWQFSTDGGGTWADDTTDAGSTTGTLSVASAVFAENGYEYRAVFTNSSGFVDTEAAKLTVKASTKTEAVKITAQPVAREVTEGETATFTAAASGLPVPTVRWQFSTDGGGTWADDTTDAGSTTGTLSVASAVFAENGYEYRAAFTNSSGSVDTAAARLTVTEMEKTKETKKLKEPIVTPKEPFVRPAESISSSLSIVPVLAGGGSSPGGQTPASSPIPDAKLTHTSLIASASGAVTVEVSCPAGESSCAGTVTLRTLGAVSVRAAGRSRAGKNGKKKSKYTVLTLAAGSFTVSGGQAKAVTLHLSTKALALLARSHVLRARATTLAHDPAGATHTTRATVTLRAPKTHRGRRKG